ncbi:MAG: hypothetical protein V3V33_14975 [Candidatus Lokiarchaeia archaeon]
MTYKFTSYGPKFGLKSADNTFGVPEGAYNDLADKWESFMKEKRLNPLFRFEKDDDWKQYCDLINYLNDLSNLGNPVMFEG